LQAALAEACETQAALEEALQTAHQQLQHAQALTAGGGGAEEEIAALRKELAEAQRRAAAAERAM
jgi:predicted  nucleic acid-binding Zn-ribbon protein